MPHGPTNKMMQYGLLELPLTRTPIGCTPVQLVYGKKRVILPVEINTKHIELLSYAQLRFKDRGDHRKAQLMNPQRLTPDQHMRIR
ncbi:hypothetical protein Tco_1302521 [Tanacetum coccineum]